MSAIRGKATKMFRLLSEEHLANADLTFDQMTVRVQDIFQPAAESSGYGAPAAEYGAPAPAYGAPEYRSVSDSNGPNHSVCPSISFCGHSVGWFFLTSRVGDNR